MLRVSVHLPTIHYQSHKNANVKKKEKWIQSSKITPKHFDATQNKKYL